MLKKAFFKISFACAVAAFFAACSTPTISSDDDPEEFILPSSSSLRSSSSEAKKVTSSSTLESSSSKKKDSSSSTSKSSSSVNVELSSSSITESSSSEEKLSSSSVVESSSSVEKVSSSSEEKSSSSVDVKSIYEAVEESGLYTTKDSVAAYICKFDKLPGNYITQNEGKTLYESKTGNAFDKWNFNPWTTLGVMIGGDSFGNKEGLLPKGSYHEADVDYFSDNRGTKRLVYESDCVIYYTSDHYKSFTQLEIR